jgi:hypothetical protein
MLAVMLALAKCQICQLERYEEYSDHDCTIPAKRTPDEMMPDIINRVNEIS